MSDTDPQPILDAKGRTVTVGEALINEGSGVHLDITNPGAARATVHLFLDDTAVDELVRQTLAVRARAQVRAEVLAQVRAEVSAERDGQP